MDNFHLNAEKEAFLNLLNTTLKLAAYLSKKIDNARSLEGFFVINDSSLITFLELFFAEYDVDNSKDKLPLSPKILLA